MNARNERRPVAEVSVIMPAWRAAATIGRALESIARQTLLPREIVVVDDGSDDDTCAVAQAMTDRLAPALLRVIRQENAGPGAARNRAITEAACDTLAFLDADDEWLPEKLAVSMQALADPGVVLVAHNIVVEDRGADRHFDCARHLAEGTDAFVSLFKRGFVPTSSVVCRRDAIEAAGRFDESLPSGQDYELWLSIARFDPRRFSLLSGYLTRYHVMPGSVTSHTELRRRCAIRIARRHAPGLRARARHPLATLCFRLAVISVEAMRAGRQGRLAALHPLLRLPTLLAAAILWLYCDRQFEDRRGAIGT